MDTNDFDMWFLFLNIEKSRHLQELTVMQMLVSNDRDKNQHYPVSQNRLSPVKAPHVIPENNQEEKDHLLGYLITCS